MRRIGDTHNETKGGDEAWAGATETDRHPEIEVKLIVENCRQAGVQRRPQQEGRHLDCLASCFTSLTGQLLLFLR